MKFIANNDFKLIAKVRVTLCQYSKLCIGNDNYFIFVIEIIKWFANTFPFLRAAPDKLFPTCAVWGGVFFF